MMQKRKLMALLVWCAVPALFSETFAMTVDDLNLKLPFPDGETWKTTCVYDDSGECSTHSSTKRDHYALDFNHYDSKGDSDDCGMTIVSAASGYAEVHPQTPQNNNDGYGNYVLVHHAGGYTSRYAHLQSITVANDTWIGRGQEVGKCGDTGGDWGCHLHFALYEDKNKSGSFDKSDPSVKPQPMDGYNDFSDSGKQYTSSNNGHKPLFNVFDKSVFPAFPVTSVNIAWYPAEVSCEKAERLVIDGGCVSNEPKKDCRDAYNDLVKIDRVYLSQYWKGVFFGDGDTSDANLQCIQRGMVQ